MRGRLALALALCVLPLAAPSSRAQEQAIKPSVPEASDRGVIERARVLKRPEYPDDADDSGIAGTVAVRVLVSASGELISARAVAGPQALRAAATQAAKAWEFTSAADPNNISGFLVFRFAPGARYAEILGLREQEIASAPPHRAAAHAAAPAAAAKPAAKPAPSETKGAAATAKRERRSGEAAPARGPARVSTSELVGKAERRVAPSYPPAAANARVEGAVVVEVLVDEAGKVAEARAVSGHILLREESVRAAREWSFKPTLVSGKPVRVLSTLIFNFRR